MVRPRWPWRDGRRGQEDGGVLGSRDESPVFSSQPETPSAFPREDPVIQQGRSTPAKAFPCLCPSRETVS